MAIPSSPTEFFDLLRRSGVLSSEILKKLESGSSLPESPAKLASLLVKKGLLTPFQAKLLLAGKHRGFRLGPYIVRDQIGQGGMGAVYLAEHESLKRKVALKVLTADKDPLAVARFAREARSAAALDHPNIVRLFDVAKHGEVHYLVMEYVDGQTMEQLLIGNKGPLPYGKVAAWAAQVALGLQHAADKGFVHRDIKPANLMVSKTGDAKILDMGLARSGDAGDKLTEMMDKGAVVGTADYIAPEQAISGSCDIRADVYALGATIYTLVSGHPPFQGTTTQKLVSHQMRVAPPLNEEVPGVPAEMAEVVARMMAKKPEDRFQTPAEAADALFPWADQSGEVPVGDTRANGSSSSVRLGSHSHAIGGLSTKRLNKPSVKTDPTPVRALNRAAVEAATVPSPSPSTGRVVKAKAASGKKKRSKREKGPPAWVLLVASGASGFIIVGIVALVLFGSGPPKPKTAPIPDAPQPQPNPGAAAAPAQKPPAAVAAAAKVDVKAAVASAREAAEQERWQDAANIYKSVLQAEPDNYEHYLLTTTLQAKAGDISGFRALRREMLSKYLNDADPRVRQRVAKSAMLLPGSDSEMADCGRMAETALNEGQPDPAQHANRVMVVAMSEYRQNRFDAAERRITELLPGKSPSIILTTVSQYVQAMAQHRLGQADKAKQTLASANEQFASLSPNGFTTPKLSWLDYTINLVLRKEAEAVLTGPASPEPQPLVDLNPPTVPAQELAALRTAAREDVNNSRWLEAAGKYVVCLRSDPNNHYDYLYAMALLNEAGDRAGCKQIRTEVIQRFQNDSTPRKLEQISKSCLVSPGTPEEVQACARMAEISLQDAASKNNDGMLMWCELSMALAEFRQGKYADADRRLIRVIREDRIWFHTTLCKAVRAMCLYRLGQQAEARAVLAQADDNYIKAVPNGVRDAGNFWLDAIMFQSLAREANDMLR